MVKDTNSSAHNNEKQKILHDALMSIEKQFGKGAVMKMGDAIHIGEVHMYHTGSYKLDMILGGGYPAGRVIEIYGPESSGKTTFALSAIAQMQREGETAAFIDAEHALDPAWARTLGVDTDSLLVSQPDYGEQALQIAQELAKSGAVKVIVVDSVAALVPKSEVEGLIGDSHVGLQARMMSQALRKLTSIVAKTGTIIIFINQIRLKIGVLYGNPETTTGGNALKFYASQRLEVRRGEKITEAKVDVGYKAKVKVVKNKVAAPFKKAEISIMFDNGIDAVSDLIEAGLEANIIDQKGAFYALPGHDDKFQGKEKLRLYLNAHPDVVDALGERVRHAMRGDSGEIIDNDVDNDSVAHDPHNVE